MKTFKVSVRMVLAGVMVLGAGLPVLLAFANARAEQRQPSRSESFFIISSVDAKKQQLVLKLPTEVTEVVEVTPETTYRDAKGNPLKFEDLRAGDTVYARVVRDREGTLTAVSIRRAPMTLEELHRRYFQEE